MAAEYTKPLPTATAVPMPTATATAVPMPTATAVSMPTATAAMAAPAHAPSPRVSNHVVAGGIDHWQHTLFDCSSDKGCCSDMGLCCLASFCAPCAYGQLVNRIKTGYPGDFCGDTGACASFLGLSFIPYVGGLVAAAYSAQTRTEIRTAYRLPETPCNDVCVHVCCLPWALFQETKEVTARQRDGQGVPASPRYAVQPMTAAPTQGVSMARS